VAVLVGWRVQESQQQEQQQEQDQEAEKDLFITHFLLLLLYQWWMSG
jgi:hypothetical protein